MTTWRVAKLGTLAEFKNGLNFSAESWGRGLKIIGVSDFGDRIFPDYQRLDEINPSGVVREQDMLEEDDIVFVRSNGNRQLIGRCLHIRGLPEPVSHSGFTIRLRFKVGSGVHVPYFVYLFRSDLIRQVLSDFGGGTNINNLNQGILENLKVPVPELDEQRKIAAILSAYDDLIANNQRRIALLEGMAEEIYREWFVRMRFPSYREARADGLLPLGWTRRPIGELSSMIKRGISPDYAEQGDGVVLNQKCIRDGKVSLAESRRHQTSVPGEKFVCTGDVLINSTGVGTLGRVAVFDMDVEGVTCDSHVTILRPDSKKIEPAYLGRTIAHLQGYFESMATGATGQAELGRELIARTKVLVPDERVQKLYAAKITPMLKQRRVLQDANVALANTRDALLPRLISGKLKVDHLDIRLPPSMRAEAEAVA